MNFGDITDAGNEILDAVEDAVNRADFSGLGQSVSDSIKKAMGQDVPDRKKKNYFLVRHPSKNGSGLKQVIGTIGEIFNGFIAGIMLLLVPFNIGNTGILIGALILSAIFLSLFLAFRSLRKKGKKESSLVDSYYKYGNIIGTGKEYFSVGPLAQETGETKDEVRDNIREMKKAGYLPYAMFDRNRNTVMLTDRAYKLYLQAEKARQEREEEERIRNLKNGVHEPAKEQSAPKKTQDGASSPKKDKGDEVSAVLSEGSAYIAHIREVNDKIPDSDPMSDKLYRLENIVRKIFSEVERSPEKAGNIRKLLNYYLPTTTKLLDAYVELYQQPQTDNIQKMKQEIESSMDTIIEAYANIFDGLFQEEAWDISSDINVMKSVMAQDGLTEDELHKSRSQKQKAVSGDPSLDEGVDEGEESVEESSPLHFG